MNVPLFIAPAGVTATTISQRPLTNNPVSLYDQFGGTRVNRIPALVPPFTCNNVGLPLVTTPQLVSQNWVMPDGTSPTS